MFVTISYFHPRLIFDIKVSSSRAVRVYTWVGSCLARQHQTVVEMTDSDKHTSLLRFGILPVNICLDTVPRGWNFVPTFMFGPCTITPYWCTFMPLCSKLPCFFTYFYFHPCPIFGRKADSLPKWSPQKDFTLDHFLPHILVKRTSLLHYYHMAKMYSPVPRLQLLRRKILPFTNVAKTLNS